MDENPAGNAPAAPVGWVAPAGAEEPRKHPRGQRLLVGAIISFVVASLLYGPGTVIQMVAFATICTAGIGGILILLGCWAVGWVALEVWDAIQQRKRAPTGA